MFDRSRGQMIDLDMGRRLVEGQSFVELPAEDPAQQFDGLGRHRAPPPTPMAQESAARQVEGHERAVVAAQHAHIDLRAIPLEGQHLPEERRHHERGGGTVERSQRPEEHLVEARVDLALLRELIGGLEHRRGPGDAVEIVAQPPEVIDAVDLGHQIELATLVELQRDMAHRLEPRPELGTGLAHTLRHRPHLPAATGEEHDDPIGLAQLVRAQHDAFVAMDRAPAHA